MGMEGQPVCNFARGLFISNQDTVVKLSYSFLKRVTRLSMALSLTSFYALKSNLISVSSEKEMTSFTLRLSN
jgi:hypothetical protein